MTLSNTTHEIFIDIKYTLIHLYYLFQFFRFTLYVNNLAVFTEAQAQESTWKWDSILVYIDYLFCYLPDFSEWRWHKNICIYYIPHHNYVNKIILKLLSRKVYEGTHSYSLSWLIWLQLLHFTMAFQLHVAFNCTFCGKSHILTELQLIGVPGSSR